MPDCALEFCPALSITDEASEDCSFAVVVVDLLSVFSELEVVDMEAKFAWRASDAEKFVITVVLAAWSVLLFPEVVVPLSSSDVFTDDLSVTIFELPESLELVVSPVVGWVPLLVDATESADAAWPLVRPNATVPSVIAKPLVNACFPNNMKLVWLAVTHWLPFLYIFTRFFSSISALSPKRWILFILNSPFKKLISRKYS